MMKQIKWVIIANNKSLRFPAGSLLFHVGAARRVRGYKKSFRSKTFARYNSMNRKFALWPSFENEEKKGQTVPNDHSSAAARPLQLKTIDSYANAGIIALVTITASRGN